MIAKIKINSSAIVPEKDGIYLILSDKYGWEIARYDNSKWEQEIIGWAELPVSGLVVLAMREEYARDAIAERWNAPMRAIKKAFESGE